MASLREQALAAHQQQNYSLAEQLYRQVLEQSPADADVLHMYGVLLLQTLRREEALTYINRALAVDPGFIGARVSQIRALSLLGRHQEVITEASIGLSGQLAGRQRFQLLAAKGQAELQLGDYQTSSKTLTEAHELNPEDGFTTLNLAIALHQLGLSEEADRLYSRAAEQMPANSWVPFNHALLKQEALALDEAKAKIQRALELDANNLAASYQQAYLNALTCDWSALDAQLPELKAQLDTFEKSDQPLMLSPYVLNVLPVEQSLISRLTRRYSSQIEAPYLDRRFSHGQADPDKQLHVGYISPDYCQHAVGMLIADLFSAHQDIKVSLYALNNPADDDVSQRVRASEGSEYVELHGLSVYQAAERIHNDGVDILVDLAGYTQGCRSEILALRPAAVQISWLGYLNTMSASFIDYCIGDTYVLPESLEEHYSESLIRLERCFLPISSTPEAATVPSRTELGLPEQAFVFACFNNSYKYDREVVATWLAILDEVPGSVLWLYEGRTESVKEQLLSACEAAGIDRERLVFAEGVTLPEHLARMQQADLFLDTFNYNAGATAVTALLAGLPILTRKGDKLLQRMGYSLNAHLGLEELVTDDAEAYRELAVGLANEPEKLKVIKDYIKAQRSENSLFDIKDMARHLEQAYQAIWKAHSA